MYTIGDRPSDSCLEVIKFNIFDIDKGFITSDNVEKAARLFENISNFAKTSEVAFDIALNGLTVNITLGENPLQTSPWEYVDQNIRRFIELY